MRGRPTSYKDEYVDAVQEYLATCVDKVETNPDGSIGRFLDVKTPTVEGFAQYIGVNKTTIYEWSKKHSDFSNAIDSIMVTQRHKLIDSGLSGKYNSTIAKLLLSANHGLREKSDVTSNGETLNITLSSDIVHGILEMRSKKSS